MQQPESHREYSAREGESRESPERSRAIQAVRFLGKESAKFCAKFGAGIAVGGLAVDKICEVIRPFGEAKGLPMPEAPFYNFTQRPNQYPLIAVPLIGTYHLTVGRRMKKYIRDHDL